MGVFFDDGFLQKYDTIWDKVSADIKKEFDSKAVSKTYFENQNEI